MSQHYSMEAPACILSSISLWSVGLEDGKGWWGQNGDIGRQQSLASRAHHLILHCAETEWTLSEMLYERLRIWTFLALAEAATSAPSFCLPSHLSLYRGSCLPLTLSHSVVFVIHYFFLLKKNPSLIYFIHHLVCFFKFPWFIYLLFWTVTGPEGGNLELRESKECSSERRSDSQFHTDA